MDLSLLFPNGVLHYALGGVLLGLAVSAIYLTTGIKAGASSFLESTLSYVSTLDRFDAYRASRGWRLLFTLGIVAGAGVYALFFSRSAWVTEVAWWRLLIGGALVGVGVRLGKGCTSGHGICGLGSGSKASLVNVAIFLTVAIGVAQLVQALGVSP